MNYKPMDEVSERNEIPQDLSNYIQYNKKSRFH